MSYGQSDRASREAGAIELAKVVLTSLVTSNSGVLVGIVAYAAQGAARGWPLVLAAAGAGFGLALAIAAAILGYISQLDHSNLQQADHAKNLKRSAYLACASLACLALAMLSGAFLLAT